MYLRRSSKTKAEVSIDEPLNVDWDGNELLLSDILGTDDDIIYRGLEDETERQLLKSAIDRLSPREKTIVELRYGLKNAEGEEMTQKEVADRLGISQSYISVLEKKIMKRLKRKLSVLSNLLVWAVRGLLALCLQICARRRGSERRIRAERSRLCGL